MAALPDGTPTKASASFDWHQDYPPLLSSSMSRNSSSTRTSQLSTMNRAADKDDVADQVVTMCRTDTMTGQTVVIDSGRTFH